MPQQGRSRRVAARQTQAGQRKKRHGRAPSGTPSTSHAPQVSTAAQGEAGPLIGAVPEASMSEAVELARPVPIRPAEPRPALYSYVKPELTRIFGLSVVFLAVLIGLSFVLR